MWFSNLTVSRPCTISTVATPLGRGCTFNEGERSQHSLLTINTNCHCLQLLRNPMSFADKRIPADISLRNLTEPGLTKTIPHSCLLSHCRSLGSTSSSNVGLWLKYWTVYVHDNRLRSSGCINCDNYVYITCTIRRKNCTSRLSSELTKLHHSILSRHCRCVRVIWNTDGFVLYRTWKEVVQKHCQARNMKKENAMDRGRWKKLIEIGWWSGWWVRECFFWYQLTWVIPDKGP